MPVLSVDIHIFDTLVIIACLLLQFQFLIFPQCTRRWCMFQCFLVRKVSSQCSSQIILSYNEYDGFKCEKFILYSFVCHTLICICELLKRIVKCISEKSLGNLKQNLSFIKVVMTSTIIGRVNSSLSMQHL